MGLEERKVMQVYNYTIPMATPQITSCALSEQGDQLLIQEEGDGEIRTYCTDCIEELAERLILRYGAVEASELLKQSRSERNVTISYSSICGNICMLFFLIPAVPLGFLFEILYALYASENRPLRCRPICSRDEVVADLFLICLGACMKIIADTLPWEAYRRHNISLQYAVNVAAGNFSKIHFLFLQNEKLRSVVPLSQYIGDPA